MKPIYQGGTYKFYLDIKEDGAPALLTGSTITLYIAKSKPDATPNCEKDGTIDPAVQGRVHFSLIKTETAVIEAGLNYLQAIWYHGDDADTVLDDKANCNKTIKVE